VLQQIKPSNRTAAHDPADAIQSRLHKARRVVETIEELIDALGAAMIAGRAEFEALEAEQVRAAVKDLSREQSLRGIPPYVDSWKRDLTMLAELRMYEKSAGIFGRKRTYLTTTQLEENDAAGRPGGMSLKLAMSACETLTMRRVRSVLDSPQSPPPPRAA
jgi:hypothetical protein